MWESIKSAAAVALITGLIWFVADRNVRDEATHRLNVRIVSESPQRYAAFDKPPNRIVFVVKVTGRRRELKEFADLVESKDLFDAVVDERRPVSIEPQALSAREILSMIRPLARSSVSYRSIEPQTERVRIDSFETVPDIRVVPNLGELKAEITINPERVSIRLPRFAALRLRENPTAQAEADRLILASRGPDGAFSVKAALIVEALKDLSLDPPAEILPSGEVTLTGQIQALTATARKGPIQITFSIPHEVQDEYRIVVDRAANFRQDIDVVGPKEQIEQLDPRDIRGLVEVLAADREQPGVEIRRKVQFILPPDCTLAPGTPQYEIAFKLEPRSAPAALGP